MSFFARLRSLLERLSLKHHSWLPLAILSLLLIAIPITIQGLITGTFETRKRALTGEGTPTIFIPPACDQSDQGIISVTDYLLANGLTGIKINVSANTPYQNAALKIIPEGVSGYFLSSPQASNLNLPPYHWYWEALKPDTANFRIEFFINQTSPGNGELCGQWNSSRSLRFRLRFAGVTSRPANDSNQEVQLYATSSDGGSALGSVSNKQTVSLTIDDSGVYHGEISLDDNYFDHHYRLRIKGPKHLQAVFADVVFQRNTELDLTSQPLKPGDLNADGRVDADDIQIINDRIFSASPRAIEQADVNFNQRVDIVDRTLVLNTLSVQYDPD